MVNDAESCVPVVQWSTTCFFVICSSRLGRASRSLDWVDAFPQEPPDEPEFMSTPRGFVNKRGEDECLEAAQLLCRSKFAPRDWRPHSWSVLLEQGFGECQVPASLAWHAHHSACGQCRNSCSRQREHRQTSQVTSRRRT